MRLGGIRNAEVAKVNDFHEGTLTDSSKMYESMTVRTEGLKIFGSVVLPIFI